ncbi:MAG: C1 family peptidase [Deltaproteobacteria bacterium]|nr:C1 family peptidase [Deltaproteobacteria bacterium]
MKRSYLALCISALALLFVGCSPTEDADDVTSWGNAPLGDFEELVGNAPENDTLPNEMKADFPYPTQFFELIDSQSPIQSQGGRGVCSIFSTVALMEHLYNRAGHEALDFSEQFLQWSVKFNDNTYPNTGGSSPTANLRVIHKYGIPLEEAWPYESFAWTSVHDEACAKVSCTTGSECDTGICKSGKCALANRCYTNGEPPESAKEAKQYFLPEGRYINTRSIKDHIYFKKTAVVVGLDFFYQSWNHRRSALPTNRSNWSQGYVLAPNSEDVVESHKQRAGHSILLIGWDDELEVATRDAEGNVVLDEEGNAVKERGFYLFKNSWGDDSFGVHNPHGAGYGFISRKYVEKYGRGARMTELPEPPAGPQPTTFEASFNGVVEHDEMVKHSVDVGRNATHIKVEMTGDNDADLYTKFGGDPTDADHDCRSYRRRP